MRDVDGTAVFLMLLSIFAIAFFAFSWEDGRQYDEFAEFTINWIANADEIAMPGKTLFEYEGEEAKISWDDTELGWLTVTHPKFDGVKFPPQEDREKQLKTRFAKMMQDLMNEMEK